MRAHKLAVKIPETRRLDLVLPPEIVPGDAEIIVLVRESGDTPDARRPGSREAIAEAEREVDAWRARNAERLLSKEDVGAAVDAERESWGDDG